MRRFLSSELGLILLINLCLFASEQGKNIKEEISITASTNQTTIPLNRTVDFSITVRWKGDQERYSIEDFDNPNLTDFEIVSTSSSNIVEDIEGIQYSKKIYSYTLKPIELGMGYVDGVFLKYTDNQTQESNTIVTKRIGIKIIKPIKEADYSSIIYAVLSFFVITAAAFYIVFVVKRKRRVERERLEKEKKVVDLESQYLQIIKSFKPGAAGDLNKFLNEISQALNKYISQKYEFETAGLGKNDIIVRLKEKDVDEGIIEKINNVIEKSDIYRFSGQTIDLSEYEFIYSLISSIIERNYQVSKELKEVKKE